MFYSLTRSLYTRSAHAAVATRLFSQKTNSLTHSQPNSQSEYVKSIDDSVAHKQDWTAVKNTVLSMRGNLNQRNVDAVMLKLMVGSKNFITASSFVEYLKSKNEDLPLGSLNSVLYLYSALAKVNQLTKEQKQFILDTHASLYKKYNVLDSATSEQLLQVLCAINEWEKALKVLQDIHLLYVPTHLAYSTLVATFFRLNKKKKALEMISESIKYKRPLQDIAYEEWLKYILRKYKDKKTIAKQLHEIFHHIATNSAVITEDTANRIKDVYSSMDWKAEFTRLKKTDGQCSMCGDKLDLLPLSDEEFKTLQENVKEKLIVGSDLLLKTTHAELKRFLGFVEKTAPYDVVLDGLNICYAIGKGSHADKLDVLNHVVEYFERQHRKVLLLGRQHMLRWNKKLMEKIMSKTCCFFTDNLSQDDPFFITAAILSGPTADIVSKDLLRGHRFNMKEERLRQMFRRWQWQHQWKVFVTNYKGLQIQPPLRFTPCAQKKNSTWHVPFESGTPSTFGMINDGIPDMRTWLCLRYTEK